MLFISEHLFFLSLFFFSLLWMFPYASAFTVQRSNSSNSLSPLPLLLLSQTDCARFVVGHIFDGGTSPSRVLPSSAIRRSRKVAARRHFISTNAKGEDFPPMQILPTLVSSASTLSLRVSSPLSLSSRVVRKENPHQPTSPYPPSWTPVQQSQQ